MAASAAGFQFGFFMSRSTRKSERNVSSVNFIIAALQREKEKARERETEREPHIIKQAVWLAKGTWMEGTMYVSLTRKKAIEVESFTAASTAVRKFIEQNDCGSSDFSGGDVYDSSTGKLVTFRIRWRNVSALSGVCSAAAEPVESAPEVSSEAARPRISYLQLTAISACVWSRRKQ